MHAQCICDTLTWLPATPLAPEASTADYILTRIFDIAHALHKPAPNSLIAALTDSQVSTLEQLMVILHHPTKGSQQHQNKKQSDNDPLLRVGPATKQPPSPSPAVVPAAATSHTGQATSEGGRATSHHQINQNFDTSKNKPMQHPKCMHHP